MSILKIPEVAESIERLRERYDAACTDQGFIRKCIPVIELVENWKYSRSQCIHPIPYESEIGGRSPGKLIKKTYTSPYEGSGKGNYCFGFINDFHVITIAPSASFSDPKEISLYTLEENILHLTHTIHYQRTEKASQLQSVGEYFPIGNRQRAHIAVGRGGNFFVYLYQYNDAQLVGSVHAYSKNWPEEIEYSLLYDHNEKLAQIVSGGQIIWPKI